MLLAKIGALTAFSLAKEFGFPEIKEPITWSENFTSFPLHKDVELVKQRYGGSHKRPLHCYFIRVKDKKSVNLAEALALKSCSKTRCWHWMPTS